jgi:NAD(P)H-hydrate repair Nnr-like enzyme with NAD(P)H-hydrate dehydratase domain
MGGAGTDALGAAIAIAAEDSGAASVLDGASLGREQQTSAASTQTPHTKEAIRLADTPPCSATEPNGSSSTRRPLGRATMTA